jgi:hypothetical protein
LYEVTRVDKGVGELVAMDCADARAGESRGTAAEITSSRALGRAGRIAEQTARERGIEGLYGHACDAGSRFSVRLQFG